MPISVKCEGCALIGIRLPILAIPDAQKFCSSSQHGCNSGGHG